MNFNDLQLWTLRLNGCVWPVGEGKRVLEVGVGRLWVRKRGDKNAWIYAPPSNTSNTSNRIAD